ncbi:MAG: hypothetical protein ACR2NR_16160 [Solirubrobacteraceae bacterium]
MLTRADITAHSGIPATTIVRTLTDISPRLSDRQLVRAINDARLSSHPNPPGCGSSAGAARVSSAYRPDPEPHPLALRG